MADGAMISLTPAIFEGDDFLVFAMLNHFASHGRAFDEGSAVGDVAAVAMKKNVAEDGFLALLAFEKIDINDVSFRNAMLSAACFNNCVSHTKSRVLSGGKAAQSSTDAGH